MKLWNSNVQPCLVMALTNYFVLHVFIPNTVYKGQKLINDVAKKTPPNTNNTIPNVPATVPVVNKIVTITAKAILIALSTEPMFFFIQFNFWFKK
jgi:hypothetical protein